MDVKKIQWLEDRILVQPDAAKETFEGSRLIKPDAVKASEKANRGVIIAVGQGKINPDTKEFVKQARKSGERILFGHYAGVDFEEAGVKYKVMRPEDVFGVLPE